MLLGKATKSGVTTKSEKRGYGKMRGQVFVAGDDKIGHAGNRGCEHGIPGIVRPGKAACFSG